MELLMVGTFPAFPAPEILCVRSAGSLASARREWLIRPAEILLVQSRLPDGDGLNFCRWVQALEASPCVLFQAERCDLPLAQALIALPVFRLLRMDAAPEDFSQAVADARQMLRGRQNATFDHVNRGLQSWRNGMQDAISLELFLSSGANLQEVIHGGLLPGEGPLILIRIRILEWHQREHWPQALVELSLTHLGRHVLYDGWQHSPAIPMGLDTYAMLLWTRDGSAAPSLPETIEALYRIFQKYLNCIPSLQVETVPEIRQVPERWRALASDEPDAFPEISGEKASPEAMLWADLLKGRQPRELTNHLHRLIASHWGGFPPNQEDLRQLYLQLLQAVELATDAKKFWTEVLSDPSRHDLYAHGNRSLDAFFALANMIVQELSRLRDTAEISLKERVDFYLENHPNEEISCADLADDFMMSPDHLNRLFRRETGETLKAYMIRKRLESARRLLILTQMPVSQVAEKAGYTSFSHFSTAYRKRYGASPMETRRAAQAES